jgi:hypothetical protein
MCLRKYQLGAPQQSNACSASSLHPIGYGRGMVNKLGLLTEKDRQLADPSFYLGIKKKKGGKVYSVHWRVL